VIIVDTSGLLAALGQDDAHQNRQARSVFEDDTGPLIISPFVLAELDYMLLTRIGVKTEIDLLCEVMDGVFTLAEFGPRDLAQAVGVIEQYADHRIGLADASIVVLAARYNTTRVLTFDQRHFRAMKPLGGGSFTALPADSEVGAS
jgi:predicted nucleic acid-binding protein